MFNVYYRMSDKGYPKPKLPGATKEVCLHSCVTAFAGAEFVLIQDNCTSETVMGWKHPYPGFQKVQTSLGNAGSLRYAIDLACELPDEAVVYFCEDDYLHRPEMMDVVREGLGYSDYVTLYDHPDKYTALYDGGEVSKVFRTASTHWRYTVSTCMTFGVRAGTLKADYNVWKRHTEGGHPNDHGCFVELGGIGRKLAVCIPGAACHTDLTFSGQVNHLLMESWAIEQMIEEMEWLIEGYKVPKDVSNYLLLGAVGWERLTRLDALVQGAIVSAKKAL